VAIVQISQITNRKGLQIDLPQLAGAELGWSIDERRLFIGNGTLEEGAPVIGNTEILTEFSDILAFQTNYTYKGEAAGYTVQTGPTPSTPVTLSLQSWLDQFATVKDFGAVGDGVTDDTDAINRALYQLFCREVNPQIRRSLFFPAGIYRVTETILIPPYATLWGEGADNSIIRLDNSNDDSTLNAYVARTADSLQQYGVNIGTNGATAPQFVTITNMGFENLDTTTDVFLVEDATNCSFQGVSFVGPLGQANLVTAGPDTAGLRFASTASLVCSQIVFDGCKFSGTTFGLNTDQQVKGVTVCNSQFDTLHQGVLLGTGTVVNGGATGVRIVSNIFDNIYAEGIIFGDVELNASGHNIFYDVGDQFAGVTNPATTIIDIQSDNNVSISDLFERADAFSLVIPRINLNGSRSIGMVNGKQLEMGTFTKESGLVSTLINNTGSPTSIFQRSKQAFFVEYTIVRDTAYRTGKLVVASSAADSSGDLTYVDDYVENNPTGITLTASEPSAGVTSINYVSTNTGVNATIYYSVSYMPSTV
jgi:hypothetical protein